jgi:hypothetical protein
MQHSATLIARTVHLTPSSCCPSLPLSAAITPSPCCHHSLSLLPSLPLPAAITLPPCCHHSTDSHISSIPLLVTLNPLDCSLSSLPCTSVPSTLPSCQTLTHNLGHPISLPTAFLSILLIPYSSLTPLWLISQLSHSIGGTRFRG